MRVIKYKIENWTLQIRITCKDIWGKLDYGYLGSENKIEENANCATLSFSIETLKLLKLHRFNRTISRYIQNYVVRLMEAILLLLYSVYCRNIENVLH